MEHIETRPPESKLGSKTWLASTFGIPTVIDGQAGFIPTPLIFQVAGLATLVALIPMIIVKDWSEL